MNRNKWTRREVLRGAGAGMALLPFIPPLSSDAEAGGAGLPKRLFVYLTPGGLLRNRLMPTGGTESDFDLTPILQPLADHRADMVLVEGMTYQAGIDTNPYGGHAPGMATMLTGRTLLTTELIDDDGFPVFGFASGPSVDQFIASQTGAQDPYLSLEAGVMVGVFGSNQTGPQNRMIYRGADQPIPPENDPAALYDRVFGELDLDENELLKLRARRLGVVDYLKEDIGRVRARVGATDRAKIDAHLQALAEIEGRLSQPIAACDDVPIIDYDSNPEAALAIPNTSRAQLDILAEAFGCGLTRVASIQNGGEGRALVHSFLGHELAQHHYEHAADGDDAMKGNLEDAYIWAAGEIAYFIDRLKAIPEGTGSVFDNTTVLWCTGMGKGNTHELTGVSAVMFGGGGRFETGRHINVGGANNNALLVSLCHAAGLDDVDVFGDAAYGSGGLPGL